MLFFSLAMAASILHVSLPSGVVLPQKRDRICSTSLRKLRVSSAASNAGEVLGEVQANSDNGVAELLKNSSRKSSWWAPLFNFTNEQQGETGVGEGEGNVTADAEERELRKGSTSAKFKLLRQKLRGLDSHHDCMYHSSIASRLALD